ncbi:MAG: glutamate decarboxylase, partial [Acidimicrobiia bacterium]|nr:glutamate decarboxylase [Acidimicrobiia bacterium]
PRWEMPDGEMPADAAYQLIHDELQLDGTPVLNLASFVTTWMEPQADKLFAEVASKNFIDQEEYPATNAIERRCVSILAHLFGARGEGDEAVGTSTIGSSEAIHLCGLAMKRNWAKRREAAGKDATRPNLVMSSAVHVTWEKFCRYFDVECRERPLAEGRYVIDPEDAIAACDENTIGVVGILGTTYTGHFEPISALNDLIVDLNERTGWQVALHVDAASGGFVAPFVYPDLEWDFRLPAVRSINTSGHKYGLVYPGVGWALWRDKSDLPEELIFHDSYLGNDQSTFDLNFSKGSASIVGQYYNFIRLGRSGYTSVMHNLLDTCAYLTEITRDKGRVDVLSEPRNLPVACLALKPEIEAKGANAHDVADHMRRRGWIVPAYTMPADIETKSVLRVVVREGFSRDLADRLLDDVHAVAGELYANPPHKPMPHRHSKNRVC